MTPSVARRAFIEESPFVVDLLGVFRLPGVYAFKQTNAGVSKWITQGARTVPSSEKKRGHAATVTS